MIIRPGRMRSARAITPFQRTKSILAYFGGALYVPSPASCFQDAAGTIAGAVDAPVGKLLDLVGANHATQATAGARPILRKGAVNRILNSGAMSAATWVKTASGTGVIPVVTDNYPSIPAPDGSYTASRVQFDRGAGGTSADYSYLSCAVAGSGIAINRTNHIWARTVSGVATMNVAGGGTASNDVALDTTWRQIIFSNAGANSETRFMLRGAQVIPHTQTADVLFWHPQSELGGVASQHAQTGAAPASNGVGPYWLDFDGVDDDVISASPAFAGSDNGFFGAAVLPTASNAANHVLTPSQHGTTAMVGIYQNSTTGVPRAFWKGDAGANVVLDGVGVAIGVAAIYSAKKAGTTGYLRKNGAQVTTGSLTPAGTMTLTSQHVGNGGAMGLMQGANYGWYTGKGAISDNQLLTVEKYLGSLAGLSI